MNGYENNGTRDRSGFGGRCITLRQPATRWQDALPSGNGRIGALVYGNIASDIILVNHKQLWYPVDRVESPDLASCWEEVRGLMRKGRCRDAQTALEGLLEDQGYPHHMPLAGEVNPYHPAAPNIAPYHPAFDVLVRQDIPAPFTHYRRSLRMATGEARVSWRVDGHDFSRDLFVSRADDCIVLRITSTASRTIDASVGLRRHEVVFKNWLVGENKRITYQVPIAYESEASDGWLTITGSYRVPTEKATGDFGGVARVTAKHGEAAAEEGEIRLSGCDEVLVLIKLFHDTEASEAFRRLREEIAALPEDYGELLHRNRGEHGEIFDRVSFALQPGEETPGRAAKEPPEAPPEERTAGGDAHSIDELMLRCYDGEAPTELIEKMFFYGRYLLLASSRSGSPPAHLTGVWNGDYYPTFFCQYTHDTDLQENYWLALPGGMPETAVPYFDYYDSLLEDWRANAKRIFGCRGIYANLYGTTNGSVNPVGSFEVIWPSAAGWLAQLYHDSWLYSGDERFLRDRVVPLLCEIARFYEDYLVDDEEGRLALIPSWSPENTPAGAHSRMTINATIDVAVAREVLKNLTDACEKLGMHAEELPKWRDMLRRLPEYRVNEDGALCEWVHPDFPDQYRHRHVSHLYPIYPGFEITEEDAPELLAAGRVALEKRMEKALPSLAGWSLPYLACCFARVGDGNRALHCLELLLRSCVGSNLFAYHNDWRRQGLGLSFGLGRDCSFFSVDGNLGFTAAVQEMLLFSKPGFVSLLPALPDRWEKGRISGLRCRGGVTADIRWEGDSLKALLLPDRDQKATLKCPRPIASIRADRGGPAIEESILGSAYRELSLREGRAAELVIALED